MEPDPATGYPPPPPTAAPPVGWTPQRVVVSGPPRELPGQDHAAIDEVERRSGLLTRAIWLSAAAVLAVLLLVLAGHRFG